MYLPSAWWPVSTRPGLMEKNRMPSALPTAANLATATFIAALLITYGPASSISYALTRSRSAMPDDKVTIFFACPLRMRGRNKLNKWMLPMTLTWKDSRRSFSRPMGSWPLQCEN